MDHQELCKIKARRGFVESPSGGFVRSVEWHDEHKARLRQIQQELATRLANIAENLDEVPWEPAYSRPPGGPRPPVILSWAERIRLAVIITWRLITIGTRDSIQDLFHG